MDLAKIKDQAVNFEHALSSLITFIEEALSLYKDKGGSIESISYRKWNGTALRLLSQDLEVVAHSFQDPSRPTLTLLLKAAQNEIGLGKKLDTFVMDIEGEQAAKRIEIAVSETVGAASQLIHVMAAD